MHILFLTDNFPPEVNAPASRTFEHCRQWVLAGHQVTVITGVPNFPTGKVFAGYRNRFRQEETVEGIRVVRVWTYVTANEGFLRRSLDYASFMAMAILAAPFVRSVDLVIGTSPQFFAACAAWLVAATRRRPFIFELRDLWPESIRAVGAVKSERLLRVLERVELFLYRRAAAVVAVTHSFRDDLVRRGVEGGKISVVTNGVDLARFTAEPRDETLAKSLGLGGKFVVGYIGTHGLAHGLETLLEAAAISARRPGGDRVRFLFLGDGARKAELKAKAAAMGLYNVLFLDTVPKEDVPRYWSLLDASIIHLKKTALFQGVIPSKLFESMAMGIPVLHGVEGESAAIVEREGAGLTFGPEDAAGLADRVLELANDEELRRRLGAQGRAAAPRYDRTVLARDMLAVLERLLPAKTNGTGGCGEKDGAVKILSVVGARPNFMKVAPIIKALAPYGSLFEHLLVHTGQHYDDKMSATFFSDLGLPRPDVNLEVGSGTHAEQTAKVMVAIEPVLRGAKPDLVIVVGDVNSTLAAAVTAKKLGLRVAHVEAGLRSFDRTMPEEINRLCVDAISDDLFTTDEIAGANLRREGVDEERIHFVGNVMIDSLLGHRAAAVRLATAERLGLPAKAYGLLTLHRPANVDDPAILTAILDGVAELAERMPVVFPIHPRTGQKMQEFGLHERFRTPTARSGLLLTEPLGYLEFLGLMDNARLVLTDSGGVQEETTILGVPCITLRPNTERPITVSEGTNRLAGSSPRDITAAIDSALAARAALRRPEKWDGHAAERLVAVIAGWIEGTDRMDRQPNMHVHG